MVQAQVIRNTLARMYENNKLSERAKSHMQISETFRNRLVWRLLDPIPRYREYLRTMNMQETNQKAAHSWTQEAAYMITSRGGMGIIQHESVAIIMYAMR